MRSRGHINKCIFASVLLSLHILDDQRIHKLKQAWACLENICPAFLPQRNVGFSRSQLFGSFLRLSCLSSYLLTPPVLVSQRNRNYFCECDTCPVVCVFSYAATPLRACYAGLPHIMSNDLVVACECECSSRCCSLNVPTHPEDYM